MWENEMLKNILRVQLNTFITKNELFFSADVNKVARIKDLIYFFQQ
jgi:hypothetical protein